MTIAKIADFLNFRTSLKLGCCLGLAGTADFLFYGQPLGCTLGLFGSLLTLACLLFHYRRIATFSLPRIALAASFGLALELIEAPGPLTFALYVFTVFGFAVLARVPFITNARIFTGNVYCAMLLAGWYGFKDGVLLAHILKRHRKVKKHNIIGHWLMPLAFFGLFLFLFAKANPVLSLWLSAIDWEAIFSYISPARLSFWFSIFSLCWAIVRPHLRRRKESTAIRMPKETITLTSLFFNERSIRIALILFNALFGLQNAMDIAILWSGAGLPAGVTYAQYAHDGAYPLILTALLAGLFVLIALKPGSKTEAMPVIRTLVYAWVGQNIFLVLSSILRLNGYIEEFSLTQLRLSAIIWMGLVAAGLALIIARIYLRKSNLWLINANALVLYSVLYLCCLLPFGGMIAEYNVHHCREVTGTGAQLDIGYMYLTGPEALPALLWFQQQHPREADRSTIELLRGQLKWTQSQWRQWSFRNYQINAQVTQNLPSP